MITIDDVIRMSIVNIKKFTDMANEYYQNRDYAEATKCVEVVRALTNQALEALSLKSGSSDS